MNSGIAKAAAAAVLSGTPETRTVTLTVVQTGDLGADLVLMLVALLSESEILAPENQIGALEAVIARLKAKIAHEDRLERRYAGSQVGQGISVDDSAKPWSMVTPYNDQLTQTPAQPFPPPKQPFQTQSSNASSSSSSPSTTTGVKTLMEVFGLKP